MTTAFWSSDMVTESNTGLMVLITKVSGTLTKLRDKVLSGMLKVMCTMVNSETIWPTATESTLISMAASTKESSRTMSRRGTVRKSGSMVPSMSVLI